jgi:hypothetical protein
MKLWEKPSAIIYKISGLPFINIFRDNSPEKVLNQSLSLISRDTVSILKDYVKSRQTQSGGFADKAGNADLYYTLFGHYIADALGLKEMLPAIRNYVEEEIWQNNIKGVHLNCAAILSARLGIDKTIRKPLSKKVRNSIVTQPGKQPLYGAFLNLLTCYYLKDLRNLNLIRKQLNTPADQNSLPCPVVSALIVLQHSFNKPKDDLKKVLFSFYTNGGFRATHAAPVPDLLSTAVSLYALRFTGSDLREIKPDCLEFTDSLFAEGGFGSNILDHDPDIEYTFYGLLALGSLAD